MLADYNSKPLSWDILLDKILWFIGEIFYPPNNTIHYTTLELDKYPVGKKTQNSIAMQDLQSKVKTPKPTNLSHTSVKKKTHTTKSCLCNNLHFL